MQELLSNSLTDWITALIIFAAVFTVLFLARGFLLRRARNHTVPPTHLQALVWDLAKRTRLYFILFVALWAGSFDIALRPHHEHVWHLVVMVAALLQAGLWGGGLVLFWAERIAEHKGADAGTKMTINVVGIAMRVVLWLVVLLVVLDNLGINITALVTGLGIGGIAVALAVQNILGDLFAALSIVLDKPFVVGDAINVGDAAGSVEHIGLKSTRLRSDTGELIIISNGDLLKSRIRNFRGQEKRQVILRIGLAYDTPAEKLELVPKIIREVATREPNVRFDRSNFTGFGTFALTTETVYAVFKVSYAEYMDTQQRVNLEILRRLSAEGIVIAHQVPIVANPAGGQAA